MRRQKKNFNLPIEEKYNVKLTGLGLFIFSFLTVLRESFEIVIFIIPLLTDGIINIVLGAVIGFALSLIVMFLFFKTSLKLNLNILFDAISFMMIYIGASMFGEGLSTLIQNGGTQIEMVGMLIYGLPVLFIFTKSLIKDYIRK
jgi:high-affinity iron transporter